jgi:SSS family solute:Na+ symporter
MEEPLVYLLLDAVVFFGFIAAVLAVGIGMSRHEKDTESYFLAGRGLSWWLIGFSLIAANISTEQFVGMSGQAANYVGLAIASYEWMAAITLVVVAFFFLPAFLRAGVYTIPEFLEYRFSRATRSIMSLLMMVIYVLVTIAAVIYSGAKTIEVLAKETRQPASPSLPASAPGGHPGQTHSEKVDPQKSAAPAEPIVPPALTDSEHPGSGQPARPGPKEADSQGQTIPSAPSATQPETVQRASLWGVPINLTTGAWLIGLLAAIYVVAGGLKACAWADLLQGSALILAGAVILVLALGTLGQADLQHVQPHPKAAVDVPPPDQLAQASGVQRFYQLNRGKLHMVLPAKDIFVPWTALVLGLWIPNFYYWGLNQYIVQRTLGSRSLSEGQKGVVFAAGLKLLIPFIVVFPGMIAFNLFSHEMRQDAQTGTNRDTLAEWEKLKETLKTTPERVRTLFEFNDDFAGLYPELAHEMLAFNRQVAARVLGPEELPQQDALPAPNALPKDSGSHPAGTDPAGKELVPVRPAVRGAQLAAQNDQLLKLVRTKNRSLPPEQQLTVAKKLIGYEYDSAFGLLIKRLVYPGLRGFVLAAILGAVISSLAAMLNAASTIFTMDLYRQYLFPNASQSHLVRVGRWAVAVFAVIGCLIAPLLGHPAFGGIFTYIQEFQGFISPGVLGVFIYGLFVPKAPRACGVVGLLLSPIVYGSLKLLTPEMAFLDRMALTFLGVLVVLGLLTWARPLPEPVRLPQPERIELLPSSGAKRWGLVVVLVTLGLYILFW